MRNSWQRSLLGRLSMKLPHQAGWETADLGEIGVLCALIVLSGWMRNSWWRRNICSLCFQSG